jgi:hypothetical protein
VPVSNGCGDHFWCLLGLSSILLHYCGRTLYSNRQRVAIFA